MICQFVEESYGLRNLYMALLVFATTLAAREVIAGDKNILVQLVGRGAIRGGWLHRGRAGGFTERYSNIFLAWSSWGNRGLVTS
jgi:hypothetical protein